MSRRQKHRLLQTGMALLVLFTIFCLSLSLTLWLTPLYRAAVLLLKMPEETGVDADTICENYRILIRYLCLPWGNAELIFKDFACSEHGLIHFKEVRTIVLTVETGAVLGLISSVLCIRRSVKDRMTEWMRYAVIVGIGLILGTAVSLTIDAYGTFVLMHRLLFTNTYWMFDPETDPVINILTGKIFLLAGAETGLYIIIGLMLVFRVYLRHRKVFGRK